MVAREVVLFGGPYDGRTVAVADGAREVAVEMMAGVGVPGSGLSGEPQVLTRRGVYVQGRVADPERFGRSRPDPRRFWWKGWEAS